MKTEKISHKQVAMLTACYVTSGTIVSITKEMIDTARQDAWMGFYLPMVYALLIILVLRWLFRGDRSSSLFSLTKKLMGTFAGSIVNALLFFYILHILALDLRELSEFVKTILLQRTPIQVIILCVLLLTVYLTSAGVEVLARLGHFYFFFLAITIASLPLLLMNEIDVTNLLPLFPHGIVPVLRSSLVPIAPYGEILVFAGLFLHFSSDVQERTIHPLVRGVVFSAALMTLLTVTLLLAVGVSISGKAVYPSLILVQLIHITDFLDRLDIFLVSLWIPAFIIKICVTYYVLCQCLGSIGPSERDGRHFVYVLLPFVLMFSLLSFDSVVEMLHFELHAWPVVTAALQTLLLLVLSVFRIIRSRRGVTA